MLGELERDLCELTGYDKFSFQPNRFVTINGPEFHVFHGLYSGLTLDVIRVFPPVVCIVLL